MNGQKVEQPQTLKTNDRIKLGPVLFRFEGEKPIISGTEETSVGAVSFDSGEGTSTITGRIGGSASRSTRCEACREAESRPGDHKSLAGTIDIDKILPKLLDTLFGIFPHADRGCVLLLDNKTQQMIPRAMKHRRADADESVKLSRTILKSVIESKETILSADASSDSKFNASESISSLAIRSMMCAPSWVSMGTCWALSTSIPRTLWPSSGPMMLRS